MDWGKLIKESREKRGWTQGQLALKSGVSRSAIGMIEVGKRKNPGADLLLKITRVLGFNMNGVMRDIPSESPEELLEKLRLAQPVRIPVYGTFHAGIESTEPLDYVYIERERVASGNIEAYQVTGNCMEPVIAEGDIVVVDRDLQGQAGDYVLCIFDDHVHIGKLIYKGDSLWIVNKEYQGKLEDCHVSTKIIEIIRRL